MPHAFEDYVQLPDIAGLSPAGVAAGSVAYDSNKKGLKVSDGTSMVDVGGAMNIVTGAVEKIADGVLSGNSLSFSNIPQNYTHLKIIVWFFSARAGFANTGARLRVNGNTGNIYATEWHNSLSNLHNTGQEQNTGGYIGQIPAGSKGRGATGSIVEIDLPFYSALDVEKKLFFTNFMDDGTNPMGRYDGGITTLQTGTPAITSVSLHDDVYGNLPAGCRATLYGISGSSPGDSPAHSARVRKNGTKQTVANGTHTKLTYATVEHDNGTLWDATNNRFIVKRNGLYRVGSRMYAFTGGATGYWYLSVAKNWDQAQGTIDAATVMREIVHTQMANTMSNLTLEVNDVVWLNAGDYIETVVVQSTGASRDFGSGGAGDNPMTHFSCTLIKGDGVPTASLSQPARVVDTVYQASATRNAMITFDMANVGGLLTGIEILIGPTNNPTTHVGYAQTPTANEWLTSTFFLPAGWYYKLRRSNGTANVGTVTETLL